MQARWRQTTLHSGRRPFFEEEKKELIEEKRRVKKDASEMQAKNIAL